MSFHIMPRATCFIGFLFLALFVSTATLAASEDPIEKAFNLAKELVTKNKTEANVQEQNAPIQAQDDQQANQEQPVTTLQATSSEPETSSPEQATYPGIKNERIQAGGNGQPTINIYYPVTSNPAVNTALKDFAQKQANAYEKEITGVYSEGEEKPDNFGSWEMTGFFTIDRPNPNIVSVTFNIYGYSGGAHGDLTVAVLNYDLKTGDELKFSDIFGDPSKAVSLLSELCAEKLRKSLGEDVEEDMLKEGTAPEETNFSNLALLPQAVAVEFQPYQVGPWAIGQQHVEVSLEELAEAKPSKSIWPNQSSAGVK